MSGTGVTVYGSHHILYSCDEAGGAGWVLASSRWSSGYSQ
jgi:hypothetical protein